MRFLSVFLACAATAPAQDLSGDWVSKFQLRDQKGYERAHVEQRGEELVLHGQQLDAKGTIQGGKITLEAVKGKNRAWGVLENGAIRGKAVLDGEEVEWLAEREKPNPAAPQIHVFEPTEFHRVYSAAIAPVLHIHSGDTVKTWTVDAGGSDAKGEKRSNGGNPETGPFYVEGALPGDAIAVKLNRVRLNRDSARSGSNVVGSALSPGYNANLERVKEFDSRWALDREHGLARPAYPTEKLKNFSVPLRPMMGCIGVAPPGGMVYRTGFLGAFGGNMDYNEVREGATVYLPVFEPGALLFIGDGHAAQGDGELTGDALETSMDVEFTVELVRGGGRRQNGPHVENDEYIMAMGIAGSLNDALQSATTEMSRWLGRDYGLNASEIALVLGSSMRYDIAEVVDPYVNVVAKVRKSALASLARAK